MAAKKKAQSRKRNAAMFRDALGQLHPVRSGMEQRTTKQGKKLIESKEPYNEFLSGDFDDKETKKKKQEQYDDRKRRAGYDELEREMKKTAKKSSGSKDLSLAQFVRKAGGIAPSKSGFLKGELARLGRKESGTTGLINQHNKQGRQSFSAEYMMDAANDSGFRDATGNKFENIGDFIMALELDATGRHKLHSYARNPATRKRNAATQQSLFDPESVARAQPVKRLQRVQDTETGENGTVIKQDAEWLKVKYDKGLTKFVRPWIVRAINPAITKKSATKKSATKKSAAKRNGLLGSVRRAVKRGRAVGKATREFKRELKHTAKSAAARKRREAATKEAMDSYAQNPSKSAAKKSSKKSSTKSATKKPVQRATRNPDVFQEFHGREADPRNTKKFETSHLAPDVLDTLGGLVKITLEDGRTLEFDRAKYRLTADPRTRRMWIAGAPFTSPKPNLKGEQVALISRIVQVEYEAEKTHLKDKRPRVYFHDLAEESKRQEDRPWLGVDRNGYAVIHGGAYLIRPEGIRN